MPPADANFRSKTYWTITSLVIAIILLIGIVFIIFFYRNSLTPIRYIFTDKKPALFFAGEGVPLEDVEVKDRFLRQIYYHGSWLSHSYIFTRRSLKWFPVIEPILRKFGIPDDFKYLAVAESELSNSISSKGAAGFWQFMPETAIQYGLNVNNEVDERYNIEKSTVAACKYLRFAFKELGSWTLAAASYNIGVQRLKDQMTSQKKSEFYYLKLNEETTTHIYRILAIRELMKNPAKYGFKTHGKMKEHPLPVRYFTIDTNVSNLEGLARKFNLQVQLIKILNPWILGNTLTVDSGSSFVIKVPQKGYEKLVMAEFIEDTVKKMDGETSLVRLDTLNPDTLWKSLTKDSSNTLQKDSAP
ncbi:MAG: lytic transglycosylase domain-containing protein [Bacteroidetes bacterium]|nr:lytic transglycosylase domain-containing protein [Bacteroidota bacterium]